MALSFLYLMARRLLCMLLGSFRSEHAKDIEIAVLRHQLERAEQPSPQRSRPLMGAHACYPVQEPR
jgi:hypothetical protein